MGFRCKIGTGSDPAAGTPDKKFKGLIVHAAGQLEGWIFVGQQVQAAYVSGAFFDGTEILRLADDLQISLAHAHTGSAGVVVQDDRKISSLVDCQGVLCVFTFRRQSVRRRIDHQCVGPGRTRSLRQDDRIFGTDGTGTDNQWQLARDDFFCKTCQLNAFFNRLRIVFTRCARDHDTVYTCANQKLKHGGEPLTIDGEVLIEWCDHRSVDSFKVHGWLFL